MYREKTENQWDEYTDRGFSINLNEAFHEVLPDADLDDFYGSIARAVFGLLSVEDKERLAFEGLRSRAGSCVRRDRRPIRRTNGSARWDQANEARRRGLEDHYVQTGEGPKPLLECTGWDMQDAVAYYDQHIDRFTDRRDRYAAIRDKLSSMDASVAELGEEALERILSA